MADILVKARVDGSDDTANFALSSDATMEVFFSLLRDSFGWPRTGGIIDVRYTDDDDEQAIMSTEANLRAAIMLVQGGHIRKLNVAVGWTPPSGGGKDFECSSSEQSLTELPPGYNEAVGQFGSRRPSRSPVVGSSKKLKLDMKKEAAKEARFHRRASIELQPVSPYTQAAAAHRSVLDSPEQQRRKKKRYEGFCADCVESLDDFVNDDTWSWYIWSATFLLFYGALGMFFAYCGTIIYPEECNASVYLQLTGASMFTMVFSLIPAWWFWVKTDGDLDNGGACMMTTIISYMMVAMYTTPFVWAMPALGILFYHIFIVGSCVGGSGFPLTISLIAYICSWLFQLMMCCGLCYAFGSYLCEEEEEG